MKKYFLKISGLATIAIPLVTMVACGGEDTKGTKDKTQTYDFSDAKTKIENVKSTKDRGDLKTYLEGKIKGAKITLDGIGYVEPTNLPEGVTIDSEKYTLEEVMPDNAKTFKIKVTLKKGMEETTKIIEITAKDYDFGPIKIALGTEQISTKIRGVINVALIAKTPDPKKAVDESSSSTVEILSVFGSSTLIDTDLAKIGYTKPSELATTKVEATYKLKDKSKLLEEGKIELEVTLKKYLETQKHIITLKAKNNDFAAEKAILGTTGTSTLLRGAINTQLGTKTTLDTADFTNLGYTPPSLTGVTVQYRLNDKTQLLTNGQFQIKATLTKDNETKEHIIKITATTNDFAAEKAILGTTGASTLLRGAINTQLGTKTTLDTADFTNLGYTPPSLTGVTVQYTLNDKTQLLTNGTFKIKATLTKDNETEDQIIEITATANDFAAQKRTLGTTGTSSKNKGDLITALGAKNIGDVLVSSDWVSLGYTPSSLTGVTVQYTLNDKSSASGNGKFKIKATLTKDNETKDHIIEISPAPTSTSTGV